jgi:hypothetical protein
MNHRSSTSTTTLDEDNGEGVPTVVVLPLQYGGGLTPTPIGGDGGLVGAGVLLCFKCALTKCPAAKADNNDNSPAITAAAIILANLLAFSPGKVG